MKRLFGCAVLAFVLHAGPANAQANPQYRGSLGFHSADAPIGIRWWFNDKTALDAGLGFGSTENTAVNRNLSHWAIDLGLPIELKRFDKLSFLVRPGIQMASQEVVTAAGPPVQTDDNKSTTIGVELEAEAFLTDNLSVSASHGFAIVDNNPAVGESTTNWGTFGQNFTTVGFHVYLFGKK